MKITAVIITIRVEDESGHAYTQKVVCDGKDCDGITPYAFATQTRILLTRMFRRVRRMPAGVRKVA
jgi:hypothetical protein